MKYKLLLIFTFAFAINTYGWTTDVTVTNIPSVGRSSAIAKSASQIFAAISPSVISPSYSVYIYSSVDGGLTWQPASYTGSGPGSASPERIKLVRTITDSVYCFYQVNGIVYVLNMETGNSTLFNTISVSDFDAAASTTYNAIYLFAQESGTDNIRRYGTTDGGVTWNGNTALVTGTGYRPKVCMNNGKLILNLYSPLLSDTAKSIIRGADYSETAAGSLTAGTFQDLATDVTVDKKIFQSVIYDKTVWFFYSQGNATDDLMCRVSTDTGHVYGAAFNLGTFADDEYTFDASAHLHTGGGCDFVMASATATTTNFLFASATNSSPSTFSTPVQVNDFPVITTGNAVSGAPTLVQIPGITDAGIFWSGQENGITGSFYDHSAVASISEAAEHDAVLFPNPACDRIYIEDEKNLHAPCINIFDYSGKLMLSTASVELQNGINIRDLPNGIYLLELISVNHKKVRQKFSVVH